jgi:uncharacterized protein (DUF305 family)
MALALIGQPAPIAQAPMEHHHHHQPEPQPQAPASIHHGSHGHGLGPAGATYDLRWLDAMVQHHTGALRMSEFVFNIGSPAVGALAREIWREQAQEIKAMGQWRKAWYPEAPPYPVALRAGGDPNSPNGLEPMDARRVAAMRMSDATPTRSTRVIWFLEGMLAHHGGALEMAHDALQNSTNPTIRRLAQEIIATQRREIMNLRGMLRAEGLNKAAYRDYDALFRF